LGYFERHVVGAYHRKYACDTIHREAFENTARHINPYITVKCLKPPPRQSKDDIACRWEFKQEQ
ncbi:MAG: hypothetical protein NTU41_12625, partial [Chloroflexi bacterium]|nr:hypothetical protein [Chloroflexota bacterium]